MPRTFRIVCHENGNEWLRSPAKGGALQAFKDAVGETYPIVGRLARDTRFTGRPTRVWTGTARTGKASIAEYHFTVEVLSTDNLEI